MNILIPLGWWLVPALITVVMVIWTVRTPYHGGFYGADLAAIFQFFAAVIITLATWMIYFGIGWALS